MTRAAEQVRCGRCAGNGEIVTDWERYIFPLDGDKGDEAVAECPDCNRRGYVALGAHLLATPETSK